FLEFQPRVARAIEQIFRDVAEAQKEKEQNIPVTICGTSATIPEYLLQMVYLSCELGLNISPSVPYSDVPEIKEFIRNFTHEGLKPIFAEGVSDEDMLNAVKQKARDFESRISQKEEVQALMQENVDRDPNDLAKELAAEEDLKEKVVTVIDMYDSWVEALPVQALSGETKTVKKEIVVAGVSKEGFHARPAVMLSTMIKSVDEISLIKGMPKTKIVLVGAKKLAKGGYFAGKTEITGQSAVLDLQSLGCTQGTELTFIIEGPQPLVDHLIRGLSIIGDNTPEGVVHTVAVAETKSIGSGEPSDSARSRDFTKIIGIHESLYSKYEKSLLRGIAAELGDEGEIVIVPVKGENKEEMLVNLERRTAGQQAVAVLLDIDKEMSLSELKNIIADVREKVTKDIVKLTYPEIAKVTEQDIKNGVRSIGELVNLENIVVRLLPEMASYRLSEKSIYQMRVDKIFSKYSTITPNKNIYSYLQNVKDPENAKNMRNTLVHVVNTAADLRGLGESIRIRRAEMRVNDENDPIKDVVIVKNNELAGAREMVLEETGLNDPARRPYSVIFVDEKENLTAADVLKKVRTEAGMTELEARQVALTAKAGLIDVDSEGAKDILKADKEDSMLLVALETGIISQLYKMTLEIIASGDKKPDISSIADILRQTDGYMFFTYLPKVEKVDLDEISAYDDLIRDQIKVMA
ncbi:MAG: HPr family phosphocarrier protein, partial [Candidatus Omnitrophica bacterium]|nr:HPr family phosphocarrier protein [Candidatus Omnitrophota bacterium]